jgi:hypothetical protein
MHRGCAAGGRSGPLGLRARSNRAGVFAGVFPDGHTEAAQEGQPAQGVEPAYAPAPVFIAADAQHDWAAVWCWVCKASRLISRPAKGARANKRRAAGISFSFLGVAGWAGTASALGWAT